MDKRVDGRSGQRLADLRIQIVELLLLRHGVFDRFQRLLTFLQVRVLYTTNILLIFIHITSKKETCVKILYNLFEIRLKKSVPKSPPSDNKRPKTELDEKFLSIAAQVMKAYGITSDRAISIELGRNPDFINKVRRGFQSAPADAWDILLNKYPEARNGATTKVMAQGGGQTAGTVHGDNHYSPTTLEACQLELEQHKRDMTNMRAELEKAQQQVADRDKLIASQEATIASKEEIISLLRGGYNRPN